jgi:hypothetical protein
MLPDDEDLEVLFEKGSEGYLFLQQEGDKLGDSGLLHVYQNEKGFWLSYPYPFVKRMISQHYYVDTKVCPCNISLLVILLILFTHLTYCSKGAY